MNSVDALDHALRILRNRQRRLGDNALASSQEAIETLEALREMIAEQQDDDFEPITEGPLANHPDFEFVRRRVRP